MKTLDEVETTLKEQMPLLQEQFKVKKMGIIGSLARREQEEAEDVDILVHFSGPIGAVKYLNLESYLSSLLEIEVNLVLKMGLSYNIARQVLKEALYIW
jgi:predicted nucleotidyltransferase